jgi:thymidine kinase
MIGSIEVICGPMKSGKTEELIRRISKNIAANKKNIVFKPKLDTRTKNKIVSRNGFSIDAIIIDDETFYIEQIIDDEEVICFDEAQFFHVGIVETVQKLSDLGKKVIISGLDMDYQRLPFGYMPELMAIADKIDKLTSICDICRLDNAIYTYRIIDKEGIIIGDEEIYEARCRGCF